MSDKDDLTRSFRRSSTAARLKELVGLRDEAESVEIPTETASQPRTTSSPGKLVENELMRMLQNQDTIINLLFQELTGCKAALRLLKEENQIATEDSRRLYEELKGHVVKLVLQRKKTDESVPHNSSEPTKIGPCSNCRQLTEELMEKDRTLATLMEKLLNTVNICDVAVRERNQMEQRAVESERKEQQLSGQLESATTRLHQAELEAVKQGSADNYKVKIDSLLQSESELKDSLKQLADNNRDLRRQLDTFRSELVDREMDLHKNVREMQDALSHAVRNKLELDELCSQLKRKLDGVNELSKLKISSLDQKYVETTVKLKETSRDLERDRNEYLKLIEKSSWLEKQLWQEKQERLKLAQEKEILSERRNSDISNAIKVAEENYERNRTYLSAALASQTNLVEKLMTHCKFLTERMDSMAKEHRREIQFIRRRK